MGTSNLSRKNFKLLHALPHPRTTSGSLQIRLSKLSDHHHLLVGIAATFACASVAITPFGGKIEHLSTTRRAWAAGRIRASLAFGENSRSPRRYIVSRLSEGFPN